MKKTALILSLIASAFLVVSCASQTAATDNSAAQSQSTHAKGKDLKGESL